MTTLNKIKENGLIAVLRNMNVKNAIPIATTLHESGIDFLEVTVESEEGLDVIEMLKEQIPGKNMIVGAGTVLGPDIAEGAINVGAQFVFTPNVNKQTINTVKKHEILCVAGALTPTEVLQAYKYGADAVKVFPIRALGPKYLEDLRGPYPDIPLIPTGGIDLHNIEDYLKSGAIAVGLASSLVDPSRSEERGFYKELKDNASALMQQIIKVKEKLV